MSKKKGEARRGRRQARGVISLRGRAAHDFIMAAQAAAGRPACDGDKHVTSCVYNEAKKEDKP